MLTDALIAESLAGRRSQGFDPGDFDEIVTEDEEASEEEASEKDEERT